jgi:hypothetical protein
MDDLEEKTNIGLSTWDIVAVVGYFVLILAVGMSVRRRVYKTLLRNIKPDF